MDRVYKSKNGKTIGFDTGYMGVAYLKLYDIPYTNENKILTNNTMVKLQTVYIENDAVDVSKEIKKFIENN